MKAFKGTPAQGLFGATLGFFIGFAAVALFGPTANRFQEVMHLSPIAIGFLVAMPSLSGSLLRIPFSAWVDTTGGRKPFLVLLSLSVAGMLGLSAVVYFLYPQRLTASFYPVLLALGVLCGCGIATFSVGISQVSYWFPQKKQGRALAIFAGVGNIAPGLFTLLLPFALAGLGLGASYVTWLIFLAAGTVLWPASYGPARGRALARAIPLRRAGTPEDVAEAVRFLAGAPYVTGAVLPVDGGRRLSGRGG